MSPRAPFTRISQSSRAPRQATVDDRLLRIEECAVRLAAVAKSAREARQELDEASSWGASGGSVTPGRTVSKESDPTGTVATSPIHQAMRGKLQPLTDMLLKIDTRPLEKALGEVEKLAKDTLRLAWDPELRAMLRRADEAERDYRSRRRTRTA